MFSTQDFDHLKKLCRMALTPKEEEEILSSLGRILDYMRQLDKIDTTDCKTCRCVLKDMIKTTFRQDRVENLMGREEFLENCPDSVGGMVRVPPVLRLS